MNDDFIRNLQGDWQSQDHDTDRILRRLRPNRWTLYILLGMEILGCAFALLVGLWFAWVAAHTEEHKLLFTLVVSLYPGHPVFDLLYGNLSHGIREAAGLRGADPRRVLTCLRD